LRGNFFKLPAIFCEFGFPHLWGLYCGDASC
jgi:hypothetical protein